MAPKGEGSPQKQSRSQPGQQEDATAQQQQQAGVSVEAIKVCCDDDSSRPSSNS